MLSWPNIGDLHRWADNTQNCEINSLKLSDYCDKTMETTNNGLAYIIGSLLSGHLTKSLSLEIFR